MTEHMDLANHLLVAPDFTEVHHNLTVDWLHSNAMESSQRTEPERCFNMGSAVLKMPAWSLWQHFQCYRFYANVILRFWNILLKTEKRLIKIVTLLEDVSCFHSHVHHRCLNTISQFTNEAGEMSSELLTNGLSRAFLSNTVKSVCIVRSAQR